MDVLVIVPTLGERLDLLRRTVSSIASQDLRPRTVVVVSGDIDRVSAACGGISVEVVAQRSVGLSPAINEGWEHAGADAEAWAWLGDDDELLPGCLSRTTTALASRAGASMVYGRCRYVDAEGRHLWTARPGRLAGAIAPYGPNLIPQPGSLMRADAVRRVGPLDPTLRYAMDIDLFLRLQTVGDLTYVPHELATFRWHATSTTVANQRASQRELSEVQRRHRTSAGRRWGGVLRPAAGVAGQASYRLDRLRG